MSEFAKQSTNISPGVDKVDWLVDVNYSSSFSSKVKLSFPSNTTNIIFIKKPFLFRQNCFEKKLTNQTETAATKLRTEHWSGNNSTGTQHGSFDLKMEGTHNLKLVQLTKEMWVLLLQYGITLTAEYFRSKLNMPADWGVKK